MGLYKFYSIRVCYANCVIMNSIITRPENVPPLHFCQIDFFVTYSVSAFWQFSNGPEKNKRLCLSCKMFIYIRYLHICSSNRARGDMVSPPHMFFGIMVLFDVTSIGVRAQGECEINVSINVSRQHSIAVKHY